MSMTIDWAVGKAYQLAKGKATAPTSGNKYDTLINLADICTKLWANEPGMEWSSLSDTVTLPDTVTATDTFALPDTIDYLSKSGDSPVLVTTAAGTKTYSLIRPNQLYLYRYKDACAQKGRNLVFSSAFPADSTLLGGTITVPAILLTADVTNGAQAIQVDDPLWLAYMMAAQYVLNDLTKIGNYSTLLDAATLLMQKMKDANGAQNDIVTLDWAPTGVDWI